MRRRRRRRKGGGEEEEAEMVGPFWSFMVYESPAWRDTGLQQTSLKGN
jgi:hypothetical protein